MKITDDRTIDILSALEMRDATTKDLVDWGIAALEAGKDTKSIVLLAGLFPDDDFEDALQLFKSSLNELKLDIPPISVLLIHHAKKIAKAIIAGDISPNEGCRKIGEINFQLDWPEELAEFGLLAHVQTGHENLGITAENIQGEIREAAEQLLQRELYPGRRSPPR